MCDIAGRLTWIAAYGGLGYLVGSQWEAFYSLVACYGGWLVGVIALSCGTCYLFRRVRRSAPKIPTKTLRVGADP